MFHSKGSVCKVTDRKKKKENNILDLLTVTFLLNSDNFFYFEIEKFTMKRTLSKMCEVGNGHFERIFSVTIKSRLWIFHPICRSHTQTHKARIKYAMEKIKAKFLT